MGYSPWGHKGSDTTEQLNKNKAHDSGVNRLQNEEVEQGDRFLLVLTFCEVAVFQIRVPLWDVQYRSSEPSSLLNLISVRTRIKSDMFSCFDYLSLYSKLLQNIVD